MNLDENKIKKFLLVGFFLIFVSLPAVKDLTLKGAYTSHDITHHIVRLIQIDRIIREGQFPARWTGDLNMGYGYPLFMFNYPLPQYLGEIFHLSGLDFVSSIKMVFIFSLIASTITGYVFFRSLWGTRAGLVAAIFYLYAPIRFINVYVSATIGNALAFAFIPLPFFSVVALSQSRTRSAVFFGAIGLAGVILSHNIMALMFLPIYFAFSLITVLTNKQKKTLTLCILSTTLLGFGLSSFFWLPAVIEKKYIRYDQILPGFYVSHFPTLKQLIYSPWGYGFSWPGDNNDNPGRMSNQVGLAHLFVIALTAVSLIWLLSNRKKIPWQAWFFFFFFWLSIFLMLKISIPVWRNIYWLQYIQMPWRLLAVSIFSASVCVGFLIYIFRSNFFAIAMIILVLYANRNHLRINEIFDPGENFFKSITGTTTMAGEHLPPWAKQRNHLAPAKIETVEGFTSIIFIKDTSADIQFIVTVSERAKLKVNQYYFPGWKVFSDGKEIPISYQAQDEDEKGLIYFTLDPGKHLVRVIFTKTPIRDLADNASFVSAICMVLLLLGLPNLNDKKHKKK